MSGQIIQRYVGGKLESKKISVETYGIAGRRRQINDLPDIHTSRDPCAVQI